MAVWVVIIEVRGFKMSDTKAAAKEIADKLENAISLAREKGLQTLEYLFMR